MSWAAAFRAANCWWNYNTILRTCVAQEHLFGSETLHKNLVHTGLSGGGRGGDGGMS